MGGATRWGQGGGGEEEEEEEEGTHRCVSVAAM